MDTAPHLDDLLHLISTLEQGAQAVSSTESLLEPLYPAIAACIPQARTVCFSSTASPSNAPMFDASAERWILPLNAAGYDFGALEVNVKSDDSGPEMVNWLQVVGYTLASAVHRLKGVQSSESSDALRLVQSQFEATSTIYGSDDPAEILNAVYSFIGGDFDHAQLGLLGRNSDPPRVHIVAQMGAERIELADEYIPLSNYPAYDTLGALETLNVPNSESDPFLTDEERRALVENGIGATIIAPLVVNQRLTGLIAFTHPTPKTIPPNRLRALRSMADQAAVVFENQALLQSTAESLGEVRLLYDVNRAMLAVQDILDVLRALRSYVAWDSASISHMVIGRNIQQQVDSLTIRHTINSQGENVVDIPLDQMFGVEKLIALDGYLGDLKSNVMMVEDLSQGDPRNPMNEFAQTQGFRSYVILTAREGGQVQETLSIFYEQPKTFEERTRRLYETIADQVGIVLQNQRLLRDIQAGASRLSRQVRVLQTLNLLATGINAIEDERTLLNQGIRAMVTALEADHGGITMLEADKTTAVVVSEHPAQGAVGSKLDFSNNELYAALQEHPDQAVLVKNVESDPRVKPDALQVFRMLGIKSILLLPVTIGGQVIGSIGLDLYTFDRTFTTENVNIARTMAAQIGVGLQNIRLLTDSRRYAEQLQRINSFGRSVQATLDLETILSIMLSESTQMVPVDRVSIALYHPRQNQLRVAAEYEDGRATIAPDGGPILPLSDTLAAQVWESHEFLYVSDIHTDAHMYQGQQSPVRSVMICPIRSRGRMLGLMNVGCIRPNAYNDNDVAVFQQMVTQLGVVMEAAEAYSQSQRVAKNEALVNDISTQLQQQLDVEKMLDVTVNQLGKALGAQRARIRLATPRAENDEEA